VGSDAEGKKATSKHRTGTTPFMARDLLQRPPHGVIVEHIYAYEVESWLYIFLHILLGYKATVPSEDPLKEWRTGDWNYVATQKDLFLTDQLKSGYPKYMKLVSDLNPYVTLFHLMLS
jgi:hypothetical protein